MRSSSATGLSADELRGLFPGAGEFAAVLGTKERKNLPSSAFVFPATREYPIHDEAHARAALSMGSKHESGARLAKIKATVKRRYPQIKVDG
jgi:hypothetical protein